MFTGAITALVTPMDGGGALDTKALAELVEHQIAEGIDGLVPCGTTGETPTLSGEEQALVVKTVVQQTRGRVPVIAGASANATDKAIAQSAMMAELGVDGLLHVTPYYNKPPQEGLLQHFRAIADAVELPLVLYNVPGRTGCDLLPQTVVELAAHPRIVAVKEATGSVARAQQIIAARGERQLALLSGDDPTAFACTAVGGDGVISVVSNVAPRMTHEMIAATRAGELARGRELHYRLLPLVEALAATTNPIPIKAAVSLLGFTANALRPPLTALATAQQPPLKALLAQLGLSR